MTAADDIQPTGWKVYRSFSEHVPQDCIGWVVAVDSHRREYLGWVPNDGQPGNVITRALEQYNDLIQQIDSIEENL